MRTLFALALGFIIARQIYINYDQEEARRKEGQWEARLRENARKVLRDLGFTEDEAEEASQKIAAKN